MGIYDRDYYREEQRGFALRTPRTVVGTLILVNVAIYLVDSLLLDHQLSKTLAATHETLTHPLMWWQLVTYGFVHSPQILHILFNMVQLWFLGREVEARYGAKEFLRVYLVMLLVGSLAWTVTATVAAQRIGLAPGQQFTLVGASGAVSGVVFLFVLNFPNRTLMLFPIPIPVKAWVVGVLLIVANIFGQMSDKEAHVAYLVHLAGIAFAYLYFHFKWNLGRLVPGPVHLDRFKPRPKLRVHDPDRVETAGSELGDEVDRILAKIHQQGEASLTRKERRTLQAASQQYQKRRQGSADPDA